MSGIDCVRISKKSNIPTQFMMFTVYENDEKVFEALKAGASGYLLKNTGLSHIVEALKELYKGGSPMSANIARKLVNNFQEKAQSETPEHNKICQFVKMKPFICFPRDCCIKKSPSSWVFQQAPSVSTSTGYMKSFMFKTEQRRSIRLLRNTSNPVPFLFKSSSSNLRVVTFVLLSVYTGLYIF